MWRSSRRGATSTPLVRPRSPHVGLISRVGAESTEFVRSPRRRASVVQQVELPVPGGWAGAVVVCGPQDGFGDYGVAVNDRDPGLVEARRK
jgi:hypothetical protein